MCLSYPSTTEATIEYVFIRINDEVKGEIEAWSQSEPGARFSTLPVITGTVKLFCFPFQMGFLKV